MSGQIGHLERQSLPDRRLYLPASHVLLASLNSERLVCSRQIGNDRHLFPGSDWHRDLSEALHLNRRRLLPRGRKDGVRTHHSNKLYGATKFFAKNIPYILLVVVAGFVLLRRG